MNGDIVIKADPLGGVAAVAAASALAPEALRNRPQDALVVLMAGRELGLAPMQSLRMLTVIKGKVTLSADATVALVRRSGECVEWRLVESSATRATYTTRRKGDTEPTALTWTMDQAQRAGLTGGQQWRTYPEAMLRARCAAALARIVYPDIVAGIYDPDELADPLPQQTRPSAAPVIDAEVIEERTPDAPNRDTLLAAILAVSDDAPDYVESMLARDGLDLGTAPIGRVQGALTYLGTQRGRDALAAYVTTRDAALDAEVRYDHDGE